MNKKDFNDCRTCKNLNILNDNLKCKKKKGIIIFPNNGMCEIYEGVSLE